MICALNEFNEYSLLQEVETLNTGTSTYKIRGNSLLQTLDEINGNRRVYTHAIGEIYLQEANNKINQRRMTGETDHPVIRNPKDPLEIKRQLQVPLKEASHQFTKMWMEGNKICGLMETLSNSKGIDLAKMASVDNLSIGFSCRALGKVKPRNYNGTSIMEVCTPTIFVTYDAVSDPSHKVAELKDITEVITNSGSFNKICQPMSETNNGMNVIDESNSLYDLYKFFIEDDREPIQSLLENFVNNVELDYASQEIQKKFIQDNMTNILNEYLSTSDKINGISSISTLNESNFHDLMNDYSYNHNDSNYQSTSYVRNLIFSYLQ